MNVLIRAIKSRCGTDGFLGWLHVLMLMDDTVLLATSRERLLEKLNILGDYCVSQGMYVNVTKTKRMVINGTDIERRPIDFQGMLITHCWKYVYLGAVFTADGSLISSLKEHCADKKRHLYKFTMFIRNNFDIPFTAKRKILEAAFNSALLYGCETWLGASCNVINTLYMGGIKILLGVRPTTPNDTCLIELGLPPLEALVKERQASFLRKIMSERQNMNDDPLIHVLNLTRNTGSRKMTRLLDTLLREDNPASVGKNQLRDRVRASTKSKFITYRDINVDMSIHEIYHKHTVNEIFIPEYMRVSFTRMRLSSHRLRIETGRWGRVPRHNRLCACGLVQDERHVIMACPYTQHLRDMLHKQVIFPNVLHSANDYEDFKYIHDVVEFFR